MASIDAILNVVVAGSSKVDQIIGKINQLGGVISAINQSPIDLSVSTAEAEIKRFNNAVLAIGKTLKTAEKAVESSSDKVERYKKALDLAEKAIAAANPNTKKYEQAIERRKKAAEGLTAALAELKQAEELINRIDTSGALENAEDRKKEAEAAKRLTKQINVLAEQYLKYGEAQKRAGGGQFAGPAPKTISQLNAQAQALALIASNSEVATAAFNRFTLAAELAGQATYYAQQEQLKALSAGLSREVGGVDFGVGTSVAAARSQVKEFVNSYAALTKSEAAMSAFVTQAQRLKSLLPDTVQEFTMLEEIISKASNDLKSIGSIGKIKIQVDIDEERLKRLSQLARRRGAPEAYDQPIGPLPSNNPLGLRYFAEAQERAEALLELQKQGAKLQEQAARIRKETDNEALRIEKQKLDLAEKRKQKEKEIRDVLFDAVTFGKSSEIKKTVGEITKGARNALVRGGLGLGALGLGGLYEGIGNLKNVDLGGINWGKLNIDFNAIKGPIGAAAQAIGEPINNALQGIPEIIGNFLSALGDIPGALGIAAVAAYALAPAMKTAGEAVFEAGKKFGESDFGQNIKLTLNRQTNIFEDVINAASEMNMVLDASKSGLDAVGQAVRSLPALPAAGETSFKGEIRQVADRRTLRAIEEAKARNEVFPEGITTTFIGGGARALKNAEFLADSTGKIAARSQEAADATLFLAERLGAGSTEANSFANQLELGAQEAKKIAEYLEQAKNLRISSTETPTRRFVRENIERGRRLREDQQSAEIARERSAALLGQPYSLQDVPVRGELFPGGRTETRQPDYRQMLNDQATVRQYVADILETMSKQTRAAVTLEQIERKTLGNVSESVAARRAVNGILQQQGVTQEKLLQLNRLSNEEDDRSIQIIRERNRELRQRPISFMTPQERGVLPVEGGGLQLSEGNILDPASLRADRLRRIKAGRARQEAIKRATSEGLIGGAFPLLFGQGIGASIGGLAGGVGGGLAGGGLGFGLSLIGTAVGTTFDTFAQSAKDLAGALEKPVENFDELKTAAFFSSEELERSIQRLIDFGDKATASAAIQEEAIKKIGVNGVKNLAYLGSEADRLNRAWSELGQQMQALIAGPLASFISAINQVVGPMVQAGRVEALRGSLSGAQQKELDAELNRAATRGTYKPTGRMTTPAIEALVRFEPEKVQAILDKWQPMIIRGKIKITEKERVESEIQALQKQLEVIDIGRGIVTQIRQVAREQQDLDKQRTDLVRSYEESIGSIRQRVEDEISNKRFATLQKENELLDIQGQIRLKSLEIANRNAIASAGTGQRPEVEQAAKEVAAIVADFTEQQLTAEEEAAKIKRVAALEAQNIDFEGAKFKADIEKEVSRLNVETARKVAEINEQVKRRNEEYDQNRFTLEKRITELQLKTALSQANEQIAAVQKQLELLDRTALNADENINYFNNLLQVYKAQKEVIETAQSDISKISAPAKLRGVGAVGGGGVSTGGLDKATADYKAAINDFVQAQLALNELTAISSVEDFKTKIDAFIKKTNAPIDLIMQNEIDAMEERLGYTRLINEGLTDAQAKRVIEIQQATILADLTYEAAIAELERKKAMEGTTDAMRKQIDLAIERLEITREKSRDGMPGLIDAAIESERGKQILDFIVQTKAQLNDLEGYSVRVSQSIGDAIGNSLSSGIAGLIEGTTTAKEIFGTFLKDMGMILIEEGTKMIAMYIAIGIAKQFAGLFGGSAGGAGGAPGVNVNPAGTGIQPIPVVGFPAANGAYFDSGMAYFAKGGIVGSPTLFQFADGGTMQAGLMGEAGPEAIMPLKRTPDGRLGVEAIPFQGDSAEASMDASIPFQGDSAEASMDASIPFQGQSGGTTVNNFQQLQSARIPFTKSTEQLVTESRERETVSAINNPKPLDVRFESQVINGVEYVTAEQHQRGMAQAAERGRALALSALQNSVKTRKQVGIG